MARKVGFGGGRRSVLKQDAEPIEERAEKLGLPKPRAGGDGFMNGGIFLGFVLLYAVPALFAVIGAYPLLGALSFPERAHEVEAQVSGRSSIQPPGEPQRVTSITIDYETRIGARLTTDLATERDIAIGSTVIAFYDPDAPRYVRLTREVTFSDAMDRVGDRIYFAYFALGFMALVTLMAIAAFSKRGKSG